MKPIDFRNETFKQLQTRLTGLRQDVFEGWLSYEGKHGKVGATTLQLAQFMGMSVLNVRPRTTELYQMGAVRLGDHQDLKGTEGRYVTRSADEWAAWFKAGQPLEEQPAGDLVQGELL